MRARQISALLYYLHKAKHRERGSVVVVRTSHLCGVDRQCGAEVRKLMLYLVERGVAVRHRQGVYLVKKQLVDRAIELLRELV